MSSNPYTIRIGKAPYMVFLIPWTILSFMMINKLSKDPSDFSHSWLISLVICVGVAIIFIWGVSAYRIVIDREKMIFRTIFSKEQAMISDMKKIEVNSGSTILYSQPRRPTKAVSGKGFLQLAIYFRNSDKPLIINLKTLSPKDISVLITMLTESNPDIELDAASVRLKEGGFHSVMTTAIKMASPFP